jgi:hypothetical protein
MIGYTAFNNNKRLATISIPDGATEISTLAFNNNPELYQIDIPNSVKIIGDRAMSILPKLDHITLPNQLQSMGTNAFANCTKLTEVHIPDGVTKLGASVFFNNESLVKITGKFASDDNRLLIINDTVNSFAPAGTTRCEIPQGVVAIGNDAFRPCSKLQEIIIPSSVQSFGIRAFWGVSIPSINIPEGVQELPLGLFIDCYQLKSVILPESLLKIGDSAIKSCIQLESITIPESVEKIDYIAFAYCRNLKNIYSNRKVPPTGSTRMFDGIHADAKIYVPAGSGEAYKTAQYWSDYADIIEEKDM